MLTEVKLIASMYLNQSYLPCIALFANGNYVWIFAENSIIYKISFESNLYFIHIYSSPALRAHVSICHQFANGSMHYLCFTYSKSFLLKPQGIFFSTITYMYEFNGLILLMFHISDIKNIAIDALKLILQYVYIVEIDIKFIRTEVIKTE